jgi:hypothetical protein
MRMYVIVAVAVVVIAGLLYLLDRSMKVIREAQRRRDINMRLAAVAEQAEAAEERRQAAAKARDAITSVLPAIKRSEDEEQGPRSVA